MLREKRWEEVRCGSWHSRPWPYTTLQPLFFHVISYYSTFSDRILQAANNPLAFQGASHSLPLVASVSHSHGFLKLKIISPQMAKKLRKRGFSLFVLPKSWLKCLTEGFTGTEHEEELHSDNLQLHLWGAVRRGRNAHFPTALCDLQGSISVGLFMGSSWDVIHLHDIFFFRTEKDVNCCSCFPVFLQTLLGKLFS